MTLINLVGIFLISINLISAVIFAYDKFAAMNKATRVSENTLHTLEVLGGVFSVLFLMYALNHKKRKVKYYKWSWIIFIFWSLIVMLIYI